MAQAHIALVRHEPGMQNACKPIANGFAAASAAVLQPFLRAMAAPSVYAHTAFSKAMG
jgi:hypothetical protein